MTRPLHVETKVQRGDSPSEQQRERGYEPRDASPRKVMLGIACFLALMLAGLGFAAATLGWLKATDEQPRNLARAVAITPPLPHLLAEPESARRRYDAGMQRRMDEAALDRARRNLVERGWEEIEPSPSTEAVAREHRETER